MIEGKIINTMLSLIDRATLKESDSNMLWLDSITTLTRVSPGELVLVVRGVRSPGEDGSLPTRILITPNMIGKDGMELLGKRYLSRVKELKELQANHGKEVLLQLLESIERG